MNKLRLLILILIYFPCHIYGQLNSFRINFIENRLKVFQPFGTIYYTDFAPPISDLEPTNEMRSRLLNLKTCNEKIQLTGIEVDSILSQLSKSDNWADTIITRSKVIEYKNAMQFINQLNRDEPTNHRRYFYTFKEPIFLREKNLCLFTIWAMCGSSCGNFIMQFYKLENNKWVKSCNVMIGDF